MEVTKLYLSKNRDNMISVCSFVFMVVSLCIEIVLLGGSLYLVERREIIIVLLLSLIYSVIVRITWTIDC